MSYDEVHPTDGVRNPRPRPQKFSKLVFLMNSSQAYICLNWLSGVLVGVGVPISLVKHVEVCGQFTRTRTAELQREGLKSRSRCNVHLKLPRGGARFSRLSSRKLTVRRRAPCNQGDSQSPTFLCCHFMILHGLTCRMSLYHAILLHGI